MREKYRLIIADDEPMILAGLASLDWDHMGIELVGTARNGMELLQLYEEQPSDILLTDIRMPGITGVEAAKQIKDLNSNVRIVFLTGHGEFDYARAAVKMGAVDYLMKPVFPKELQACMERVCQSLQEERAKQKEWSILSQEISNYRLLERTGKYDPLREDPEEETQPDILKEILDYLGTHYQERVSLKTLSEELHFTTVYLSRVIKKRTGHTFLEILTNIRMYHAARLLRTTDMKGYEICEKVGLADEHYFSQVFRKVYGVAPNAYKKNQRMTKENFLEEYLAQEDRP